MKLKTNLMIALWIALAGLVHGAPPQPPEANAAKPSSSVRPAAAPFGLALGSASCDALKAKFGTFAERTLDDGDFWVDARAPDQLFPGASKVAGRCSKGHLIAVQVEASKGGIGAEGAREAFAALNAKYKLVAGAPMPSLGDGYARFSAGDSVIEQSSPHLSFTFTVTYYTKVFYDALVASRQRDQDSTARKKRSSL
jgi:hypothetical protein